MTCRFVGGLPGACVMVYFPSMKRTPFFKRKKITYLLFFPPYLGYPMYLLGCCWFLSISSLSSIITELSLLIITLCFEIIVWLDACPRKSCFFFFFFGLPWPFGIFDCNFWENFVQSPCTWVLSFYLSKCITYKQSKSICDATC